MLVPVLAEFLLDVEILELDFIGRTFQLDIAAGTEVHFLAFRQFQHQFLDEGGDVVVGDDLALPLLDAEELLGNLDFHVLLHRHLAGQAPALPLLAVGEVGLFRGQHGTAAFQHLALALRAGTAAATGGRQENAIVG